MDMLCIAAEADPIGTMTWNGEPLSVSDIARMTGGSPTEVATLLDELDRNGVLSRDRNGTIYSRRMVRDAKKAKIAQKNGKQGGNPSLRKDYEIPPSDNPPDKASDKGWLKTHIPEARIQKETISRSIGSLFERFWEAYPSRGKASNPKKPALEKFRRLVLQGEDPESIISGAQNFAKSRDGEDPKYTPQATRWLNEERWRDFVGLPLAANGSAPNIKPKDEAEAKLRLQVGRERQQWPRDRWGPAPNEDGCTIPAHLVRPDDGRGWLEWGSDH